MIVFLATMGGDSMSWKERLSRLEERVKKLQKRIEKLEKELKDE